MAEQQIAVITIDGPSGSGKGTIAKQIAADFGLALLDSGALYRVLGEAAHRHQLALDDEAAVAALAAQLDVCFEAAEDGVQVILEGENVSREVRTEEGGHRASIVAALPAVREALLQRQRDFAIAPGVVADGRDMGTVVFATAPVKIFLTASAEERARRRYNQLLDKGFDANLEQILSDVQARDARDSQRSVAPLAPADDALLLDSTEMTIEQVLQAVREQVAQKLPQLLP